MNVELLQKVLRERIPVQGEDICVVGYKIYFEMPESWEPLHDSGIFWSDVRIPVSAGNRQWMYVL